MSNKYPTMEECLEAVNYLNSKYDEVQQKNTKYIPDYFIMGQIEVSYNMIAIKLLGQIIWDSVSDNRPLINENHLEFEEGVDKPIALCDHLISELMGIAMGIDSLLDDLTGLKSPFGKLPDEDLKEEDYTVH
jgi:hypothetical protein